MRTIESRLELGVSLRADEERMSWEFDKFDEVRFDVSSRQAHAVFLKDFVVVWVDFETMAMTFGYFIFAIEFADEGSFFELGCVAS